MSDDQTTPPVDDVPAKPRLSVVPEPTSHLEIAASGRPRTIGRLIATTALIADSAATRSRRGSGVEEGRGPRGLFSRFR